MYHNKNINSYINFCKLNLKIGKKLKNKICVFGGSSPGNNDDHKKLAEIVGKIIAENDFDIIFGGGEHGIMGAVSNSAVKHGSKTIGIIPEFLKKEDILNIKTPNNFNTKLISTETMHQRKELMYKKSVAFLILPGGIGTLDECCEVLTWCQLNLIKNKKVGILNFSGYWDLLISLLNNMIIEGFMKPHILNHFEEIKDIKSLKKFINDI